VSVGSGHATIVPIERRPSIEAFPDVWAEHDRAMPPGIAAGVGAIRMVPLPT
jgi:hypothetical protein